MHTARETACRASWRRARRLMWISASIRWRRIRIFILDIACISLALAEQSNSQTCVVRLITAAVATGHPAVLKDTVDIAKRTYPGEHGRPAPAQDQPKCSAKTWGFRFRAATCPYFGVIMSLWSAEEKSPALWPGSSISAILLFRIQVALRRLRSSARTSRQAPSMANAGLPRSFT